MARRPSQGARPEGAAKAERLSPDHVLRLTRSWLARSIFQGARLMALIEAQRRAPLPTKMTADDVLAFNAANQLSDGSLVEEVEAFFFLCSLDMLLMWLPRLQGRFPAAKVAIRVFSTSVPHASDLRDMRVHEDAYLTGTGNKQERYVVEGFGSLSTSAHGIVVRGDDYLLGDRLNVGSTLLALRELDVVLQGLGGPSGGPKGD